MLWYQPICHIYCKFFVNMPCSFPAPCELIGSDRRRLSHRVPFLSDHRLRSCPTGAARLFGFRRREVCRIRRRLSSLNRVKLRSSAQLIGSGAALLVCSSSVQDFPALRSCPLPVKCAGFPAPSQLIGSDRVPREVSAAVLSHCVPLPWSSSAAAQIVTPLSVLKNSMQMSPPNIPRTFSIQA